MTVEELFDILAGYIAAGRGGDHVLNYLDDDTLDERVREVIGRRDWEVASVDGADGDSDCVILYARPVG